jgi:hypothetical protein
VRNRPARRTDGEVERGLGSSSPSSCKDRAGGGVVSSTSERNCGEPERGVVLICAIEENVGYERKMICTCWFVENLKMSKMSPVRLI